jgi:hypothetical protein
MDLNTLSAHLTLIDECLVETKKRNPKLFDHKIYLSTAFDNTVRKRVLGDYDKDKILDMIRLHADGLECFIDTVNLDHVIKGLRYAHTFIENNAKDENLYTYLHSSRSLYALRKVVFSANLNKSLEVADSLYSAIRQYR